MTFALITEGISEHGIIKHIIQKYFKESEPFIRQIQPQINNEKQTAIGGWNEVLKYCQRDADIKEIFTNSDYLVIQIDTDESQTKPFNISHLNAENEKKTVEELYVQVVDKLRNLIDKDIMKEYGDKILFAICIHTIECWLLPIYYTNYHQADTTTCIETLNTILRKKNIPTLAKKSKNNPTSRRTYEVILKEWRSKKDLTISSQHNFGFKRFIESLETIESEG